MQHEQNGNLSLDDLREALRDAEVNLTRVLVRLLNVSRRVHGAGTEDDLHYAVYDAMLKSDQRFVRGVMKLAWQHDREYVERMERLIVESSRNSIALHLDHAQKLVAWLEARVRKSAIKDFVLEHEDHIRAALWGYEVATDRLESMLTAEQRLVEKRRASADDGLNTFVWDVLIRYVCETVVDVFVSHTWNLPNFGGRLFSNIDGERVLKVLRSPKAELRLCDELFKAHDGPRGVATLLVGRLTHKRVKVRQGYKRAKMPVLPPQILEGPGLDDHDDPVSAMAYFSDLSARYGETLRREFWPSDFPTDDE